MKTEKLKIENSNITLRLRLVRSVLRLLLKTKLSLLCLREKWEWMICTSPASSSCSSRVLVLRLHSLIWPYSFWCPSHRWSSGTRRSPPYSLSLCFSCPHLQMSYSSHPSDSTQPSFHCPCSWRSAGPARSWRTGRRHVLLKVISRTQRMGPCQIKTGCITCAKWNCTNLRKFCPIVACCMTRARCWWERRICADCLHHTYPFYHPTYVTVSDCSAVACR